MSFDGKQFEKLGYTKPRVANQVSGGRGGGHWNTCVLATDLRAALADAELLAALAGEVKRGDRVYIGAYLSVREYGDEVRDAVAQVLVTDVEKPDKSKGFAGRVDFRTLDLFSLGRRPEKVIQDRGEVEVVA